MFDKNELCILLSSLEGSKNTVMISCIFCELVDYREDYAKTKYCVEHCTVCKKVEEIDSLISKIREMLK